MFGPGVGECVVIHLTGGRWVVVDSCIDTATGQPAALRYLERIGVDIATAVDAVVATHWDDDHSRGMADTFEAAERAGFFCSAAIGDREVQALIALYGGSPPKAGGGTREMWRVLDVLRKRKSHPTYLKRATTVHRREADGSLIHVESLTPSDAAFAAAVSDMIELVPSDGDQRTYLPWRKPNRDSVVLWLNIRGVRLLLGADLEEATPRGEPSAWSAILADADREQERAELFKIPHHGSTNAFNPEVWEQMLAPQPLAVLTPFRQGGTQLPTKEGIGLICGKTNRGFWTRDVRLPLRHVSRSNAVEKTIAEATIEFGRRSWPTGHTRFRKVSDGSADWKVDLFDGAGALPCDNAAAAPVLSGRRRASTRKQRRGRR